MSTPLRYLWASPATAIGLVMALAAVATGGSSAVHGGVVEAHGGAATWFLTRVAGLWLRGGAAAMTLGHVVIGRDAEALQFTRSHERVHVRQYERWGPLFLPAYAASSAVAWITRRDPYLDNRFEAEAYRLAPRPPD